jgi:hypothetical protein
MRETLCASRINSFVEASKFFTHTVFQLVVFRKTASSECILQEAKKMEVEGYYIGTAKKMRENSPLLCCQIPLSADWCAVWRYHAGGGLDSPFPFSRTLRIRCFNFLNIWTYCSELVVVPLSKNSTYKIPSLSQKTLAMNLPAKVCTLNFFVRGNERGCHSTFFHWWVVRMNPGFTTCNYCWPKSISVFPTVLEKFCADYFSGCFAGDGEHFRHPSCVKFSVAKLYDDSNNGWLSFPWCGAQFTRRNAAVLPNRRINIVVGYRGWSAVGGPVIRVPFTDFKTTDPGSNWPNIYGILTIHTPQTCMNPYGTGAFQSKKFIHLSLPSTYVHNIRQLSHRLCWTQVTDWSIDDPAGTGHCPTGGCGKKFCLAAHLKKDGIKFVLTFMCIS